ncbi:MAG: hypothetical protein F4018_07720 [Acidobacteria bacterium]|nr:hypothetical protein [Acidobacteriota bacterium]
MQSGGLERGAAVVLAVTIALAAMDVAAVQEQESEAGRAEDDDRALRRLPAFGALDTDDDDDISAAEMDAAAESLATLDEDGDGNRAADERRPRRGGPIGGPARTPPAATAAFMTFDADEDGLLERTELASQFRSLLTRADSDGDGAASEAEILALLTVEAEPPPEPEPAETGSPEGEEAAEADGGPERPRIPLMAALDADGDGAVSASEIASAAQSLRSLDADGDGRLAMDELRPAADGEPDGEAPPR